MEDGTYTVRDFIPHEAAGWMGYESPELGIAIFHEARVE